MTAARLPEEAASAQSALALVALGSNLGDRLMHIRHAVERLAAHPAVRLLRCSRVIETPPMGPQDQGPYLNAVVAFDTNARPDELLALCRQIEKVGRRQRTDHWGPRTIDLDLVDVGGRICDTPELRLPHPGVGQRAFVLIPLSDVAPAWRHPETGEPLGEMIAKIGRREREQMRVVAGPGQWCSETVRAGGTT